MRNYDLYAPEIVPETDSPRDTQRFIENELERLRDAIRLTTVQPAFGGLAITSPNTNTANTTAQKLQNWSAAEPPSPARVSLNTTAGEITILENGTYFVMFSFYVIVTTGKFNQLTLYKDTGGGAAATNVQSFAQGTAAFAQTFVAHAQLDLNAGDILSLWYKTLLSSGNAFNVQNGRFTVQRISEFEK